MQEQMENLESLNYLNEIIIFIKQRKHLTSFIQYVTMLFVVGEQKL